MNLIIHFIVPMALLLSQTLAKTILLTNDDSWVSTYIRAGYRDLKAAGYDVILVAPVRQTSLSGGAFDVPSSTSLTSDGAFSYVKEGSPSWGHEENDKNVWYFDGSTSACVSFALEHVIPNYFDNRTIDLTISGINEGPNLSPGYYTASSSVSGMYYSLYNNIPAISFAGSDLNSTFYKDSLNKEDDNPANIYSKKMVELVNTVLADGANTLPPTVGLNVVFPLVSELEDGNKCTDPTWVRTRSMGTGVLMPTMTLNKKTGLFETGYKYVDGIEKKCAVGDCGLPAENTVFWANNCSTTVTAISIDYDATKGQSQKVDKLIGKLF